MTPLGVADFVMAAMLLAAASYLVRRSRMGAAGLFLGALGLLLLGAELSGMTTTAWLLRISFAAIALCLAVAFQRELRQAFEGLAAWFTHRRPRPASDEQVDAFVDGLRAMAERRIGALIVFGGKESLDHLVSGGTALQAQVSEPLLLSVFDPSSPGHDGAVLVRDGRLASFGLHLPLSGRHDRIGPGGTRHAAALGLAERSDARCLVVSEERGIISIAEGSSLRPVSDAELPQLVRDGLRAATRRARRGRAPAWRQGGALVDLVAGVLLSGLLWAFVAPGSSTAERTLEAPVEMVNLPERMEVRSLDPATVPVTVGGPRVALWTLQPRELKIVVDATAAERGRRWFAIGPEEVVHPEALEVLQVGARSVRLRVRPRRERPAELEQASAAR